MNIRELIKAARKGPKRRPIRAFRHLVPVKAFVDDVTFITPTGAGVCSRVAGVDDEWLTDEDRLSDSLQLMRAQKQLDESDRLYQYLIRRSDCPIIAKDAYENPQVQEMQWERNEFLQKEARFARIELYSVLYRSANYKSKTDGEQLQHERKRVCATVRAKAEAYAEETVDPFGTVILSKEDAFLFLRKLLNFNEAVSDSLRLKHDTSVDYQLCGTALCWDESLRHLRMGGKHIRVLSIKEADLKTESGLPGKTIPNLLRDMLTVDGDLIICQQWHPVEKPEVRDEVQSRKKHILNFEQHGAFTPESEDGKTDELLADDSAEESVKRLGSVLKQIENEGDRYGKFSYTVILHGEDNAKLDAAIAKIHRIWGEYDGALFEEDKGAFIAFLSILPGNVKYAVREHWMGSSHVADLSLCYAPYRGSLTTSELADGEEYLALFESRDHAPFYWDPFVGGAFGLFGTGKRGRGKTFLANFLVCSAQKYNGRTVILDLGQNYRQTVKHFGGAIVSLSLKDQLFRINPFALPYTPDNHQFLYNFLLFLIEEGGGDLQPEHQKELFEQIRSHYEYELSERTLSQFYENAPSAYKNRLLKWIRGGQYGWVFDNADDTVSLSKITCFEFAGVEDYPELVEPLVMWILGRTRVEFFDPAIVHEFKLINADEVWKFLKSPRILAWLTDMLKFGRNRLVACALWTQSAEDLGPATRLVTDNCETIAFLGNKKFDRELYVNTYGFNSREVELAVHLAARQFLLKTENYAKVLRLRVPPRQRWMFTTRPKEQRKRQLAVLEHGDQALEVLAAAGGER